MLEDLELINGNLLHGIEIPAEGFFFWMLSLYIDFSYGLYYNETVGVLGERISRFFEKRAWGNKCK